MGYEQPIVRPPAEYKGDFFKGEPSPSDASNVNVGVLTNRITFSVSFAEK